MNNATITMQSAAQTRTNVKRALRKQLNVKPGLSDMPTLLVADLIKDMAPDDYLLDNLYRIAHKFGEFGEYSSVLKTEYLEARDLVARLILWLKTGQAGLIGAWDRQAVAIQSCNIMEAPNGI